MIDFEIIDQVSDLLGVYRLKEITIEEVKKIFVPHMERFRRLGFYRPDMVNHDEFLGNFVEFLKWRQRKGVLDKEKNFLKRMVSTDLDLLILKSIEKGKSVFNETAFNHPLIVFLLNGSGTDGMVLPGSEREFGINLNLIFTISGKDFKAAIAYIQNLIAHESNHIFLFQANKHFEKPIKYHWLFYQAFLEGLATYSEHEPNLKIRDYLADIKFWLERLDECVNGKYEKAFLKISDNKNFRKYNPGTGKELKRLVEHGFDNAEPILDRIFRKNQGPIYAIGLHMWMEIERVYGTETIKELTAESPERFVAMYESTR